MVENWVLGQYIVITFSTLRTTAVVLVCLNLVLEWQTSTRMYSRVRSDILKLKGFRQIRQNFLRQMRHTILKIVWGLLCIEIRHVEHANN